MNKVLQIVLIVAAVLVVAGGLLFAGTFLGMRLNRLAANPVPAAASGTNGSGQGQTQEQSQTPAQGQQQAPNMPGFGGRGMMGGRGGQDQQGNQGFGPGAGQNGPNGMMPWDNDSNQQNQPNQQNLTPVTADEAKSAAQAYLTQLNVSGLEVGDVTIVNDSAYVVVKETTGGSGAFELIVDPRSKTAHPDLGAGVMWNLKYGGVLQANQQAGRPGRMMGSANNSNSASATATPASGGTTATATPAAAATPANVSAEMPLSAAQAVTAAQSFLDKNFAGATVSTTAVRFYGYYSVTYSKGGQVVGILTVNGFNGQVMPDMLRGGMPGRGRP